MSNWIVVVPGETILPHDCPTITLSGHSLLFNKAAIQTFQLDKATHCKIMWETERKLLGIHVFNVKPDKRPYFAVQHSKQGQCRVGCMNTLIELKLYGKKFKVRLRLDDETGYLVAKPPTE